MAGNEVRVILFVRRSLVPVCPWLERVTVGRNWAGRSLIELDLRGRVNVQVLEWRRDDQLLPIDPRAPLREGDVLALAGNREDLLAARWLG